VSEVRGEALAEARRVVGVPTYAGYATGFHAVQAYLRKSGKSAAEATLVSAAEILREGAYFA
jgi:uncharacterized protein YjaZ